MFDYYANRFVLNQPRLPLLFLDFLFFFGLGFHLLHLDAVGLSAPHVQLVIAHAQRQYALVDAQARREKHKVGRLLVHRLDHKLFVIERDVSYFAPWKSDPRCHSILINVKLKLN